MYLYFIPILLLFFTVFISQLAEQHAIVSLLQRRKSGEGIRMKEMATKFIGKNCGIATFNNQFIGVITEVTDGALLLQTKRGTEAINLDFVVRIQEFPQKNCKCKAKDAE